MLFLRGYMKKLAIGLIILAALSPFYYLYYKHQQGCERLRRELTDIINKRTSKFSDDCYISTYNAPMCVKFTLDYNAQLRDAANVELESKQCKPFN